MELERYQFTKDDTTLMKGLAILLMLAHHLWGFGDRLVSELPMISVTARGMEFAGLIGGYGKICVSMFMFLGGFGTYLWYTREKADWFSQEPYAVSVLLESLYSIWPNWLFPHTHQGGGTAGLLCGYRDLSCV